MVRGGDTHIDTLRAQKRGGRGADDEEPACLKLSLFRLLGTVEWQLAGVPPSAILVVRHLQDPLPGRLRPIPGQVRVQPDWQRALIDTLKELYRRAVRPQQGFIPAQAPAILFADEAEMLACLTLAISRQEVCSCWWWRGKEGEVDALYTLLCREVILVPSVLYLLAQWQRAAEVIRRLSGGQVRTVLRELAREYGLVELLAPVFDNDGDEPMASLDRAVDIKEREAPKRMSRSLTGGTEFTDPFRIEPAAPWQPRLPTGCLPSHLGAEQAVLLGLGLSLYCEPTTVKTPGFRQAFCRWWRHEQEKAAPDIYLTTHGAEFTPPRWGERQRPPPQPLPPRPVNRQAEEKMEIDAVYEYPAQGAGRPAQDAGRNVDQPLDSVDPVKEEIVSPFKCHQGVDTQLAGVFYLINLMQRFDLPGRLEEQCPPDSQPGAWGVLELLARGLLAETRLQLETDPLWPLLAQLDNRQPDSLRSLPWLRLVLPPIRAYLYRVLKIDKNDEDKPAEVLMLHPGRVYVSATHLDVVMSLEEISMPVRLAGLDANPGWLPVFARVIQFYFE